MICPKQLALKFKVKKPTQPFVYTKVNLGRKFLLGKINPFSKQNDYLKMLMKNILLQYLKCVKIAQMNQRS